MENFEANIISIFPSPKSGFDVTIKVYNASEFDLILDETRDTPFVFKDETYIVNINGTIMHHLEWWRGVDEVMDVYYKYEFSNNLNPKLRRLWKTGKLIDNIVSKIIFSKILETFGEKKTQV